jgi:PIN domain nuclease of toxin-antitoxin system
VYLLDTCTFCWLCAAPDKLPDHVGERLDAEFGRLSISIVTHIEISNLWLCGKMKMNGSPRSWFTDQIGIWNLNVVRIDAEDIFRASELPTHHRDPFDRLLIAQAITRNLIIITPDPLIHAYPVSTLW